ncbi:hypothetical protein AB1Y20_011828 [Prymnesium parvum]|uniref:Endonuclease/exonuclease/phosphatase domain-containing protein n=1 Tax=Prymnesium parvum TaxID=97485 RepID=A0AB34IHF5_PRYPA
MARRRWVSLASHAARTGAPTTTLLTYNILADGERLAMSPKHAYCPRELREWGDLSRGRCKRLVEEIRSYGAEVLALQECSARALVQLREGLDAASAAPSHAFHLSDLLVGSEAAEARENETGLAVYVRSEAWEPIGAHAVRLSSMLEDGRHTGHLLRRLSTLSDAAMFVLLEHTHTKQRLLVGNTHIYWNPSHPHVKAAQAELVCAAARAFAAARAPHAAPPALALLGDFNSVPQLQPAFLPASQAARLPRPLPAAWAHSAAYALLSSGHVAPDHPEHPDAFGGAAPPRAAEPPAKRRARGVGALRSGLSLRDAYAGALRAGPLPLSTHAGDFKGCLDYIWLSSPPPPAAAAAAGGEGGGFAAVELLQVLEMPYALDAPDEFGSIPDAEWPSDHLALGVRIAVEPHDA